LYFTSLATSDKKNISGRLFLSCADISEKKRIGGRLYVSYVDTYKKQRFGDEIVCMSHMPKLLKR
jgi:hypothetical protein